MMTDINTEPVSEQQARELLQNVKVFRQEWAKFAVESDGVFRAFREKGASFPEAFLTQYHSFIERKTTLSSSIALTAKGIDTELWQAPSPTDSLEQFEHNLEDLIRFARELARLLAEKRDKFIGVLKAVRTLSSRDLAIDEQIGRLRNEAESEIELLAKRPSRIADLVFEERVQSLTQLLELTQDARSRFTPATVEGPRLSAAECQTRFESVSATFGLAVAIEALRTGLTTEIRQEHPKPVQEVRSTDSVFPAIVPEQPPNTEPVQSISVSPIEIREEGDRPTREALASLENRFSGRPTAVVPPARRPVSFAPVIEPNPISLSALAEAGASLKDKAGSLYPNVLSPDQIDAHPSTVKNRAIGLALLAEMIEIAGYIFAERERNSNFLSKNLADILKLFAEVQNVVRVEAEQAGKPIPPEQSTAFQWLKHTCGENAEAIHIERFMRKEDRADPANNPELARRVLTISKSVANFRERERGFEQLKLYCQQLTPSGIALNPGMEIPFWEQVNKCVMQLTAAGMKPSDPRARGILLPIIDNIPEQLVDENGNVISQGIEISNEFQQVLNSIYEYTVQQPVSAEEATDSVTEDVIRVRGMLQDKILVIVGGIPKPQPAQRLKNSFKCREVRWLEATKQDRVSDFRPSLSGAAVVVLITRLIGHKHNDIRDMCREAGIPCIHTPFSAGYNPNTIAAEIIRKASDRLQSA
jgi:hypothetical protein